MSISGEMTAIVTEEKTGDTPRGSPAEYMITREKQLPDWPEGTTLLPNLKQLNLTK